MFNSYHSKIESSIENTIKNMGRNSSLVEACRYALTSGGKRIRPILTILVSKGIGKNKNVMPAALSVEFFHTASLIADDLPCMDDDDFRRGKASLHKAFDESTALLASYTLIALGYEGIYLNSLQMPECGGLVTQKALEVASRCAGIRGATMGQYLDLFPPEVSWSSLLEIIEKKTISLFQLSFAFGWIFGGGDLNHLHNVEEAAYNLGLAFQVADDLVDFQQDQSKPNAAHFLGKHNAQKLVEEKLYQFEEKLKYLEIWSNEFKEAAESVKNMASTAK
jgi:geranylgeranyl diphosphate synthase type II